MYLRYVYKLHDLHIASDNWVEAGCTLLVSLSALLLVCDSTDIVIILLLVKNHKSSISHSLCAYYAEDFVWEIKLPVHVKNLEDRACNDTFFNSMQYEYILLLLKCYQTGDVLSGVTKILKYLLITRPKKLLSNPFPRRKF